jgi:hypothetical protein
MFLLVILFRPFILCLFFHLTKSELFIIFLLSLYYKAGEVLTLPIVVLVSLLAQPRLFYALSQDGLLVRDRYLL